MNLGLLEVDLNENIIYANKSFARYLNYTIEELIGQNASSLLMAEDESLALMEQKVKAREKGISDLYEVKIKDKFGNPIWMMIGGAPLFNSEGEVTGSIGIHLDITDQKKLENELRKARTLAEDSVKAKENFLATMSHEIRTPLNGIIGMAQILHSTPLDSEQYQFLAAINSSANNLLALVNDILDFSKIEAGRLELEEAEFDLKNVIENIRQALVFKANEKGINIKINYDEKIPKFLVGDQLRLYQIILNLAGNALKFTESGYIELSAEVIHQSDGNYYLRFLISDTGIGISPDKVLAIFEEFTQVNSSIARKYGGTGLGLNISLRLVELMKGNLIVSSEATKGTVFGFTIQFKQAQSVKEEITKENIKRNVLKGLKVLVVDDNDINLLIARTMLTRAGAEVMQASDGLIALELFSEHTFDIILMDMQMPDVDGLTATQVIRKEYQSQIPILGLTANAFKSELDKCIDAGMNDAMSKPFKEMVLINKIYSLCEQVIESRIQYNSESNSLKPEAKEIVFNLDGIKELSNGNIVFYEKMIVLAAEQLSEFSENFKVALVERNFKEIAKICHKIKPIVSHLRAYELVEISAFMQNIDNITIGAAETFLGRLVVLSSKIDEIANQIKDSGNS